MKVDNAQVLITCILPNHQTRQLLDRLQKEQNVITANKSSARGSSYTTDFKWVEMEVLEVVVPKARRDEVFIFLYEAAELDKPGHGMIYEHDLEFGTVYTLPAIEG